ncbi:MAG: hypothetical protein C0407_15370 [Desulfobacca sp.]|nr:hypothetical protein [Desulfobacca sp.]
MTFQNAFLPGIFRSTVQRFFQRTCFLFIIKRRVNESDFLIGIISEEKILPMITEIFFLSGKEWF